MKANKTDQQGILLREKEKSEDKDHVLAPKVNPFRPDLPFSKKEQNKEAPVNRTTEW